MFDSVTRFAKAQREVGLAIGEPPAQRGYTPSVFETLPKLLERSGTSDKGSITGFYTVLVDGDDMDEPISDTVRGILDGHVILSRKLAQKYHYPAIDVLASISRLANRVSGPVTKKASAFIRRLMAVYAESEDMINVGAYQKGTNPAIDEAIALHESIESFLNQEVADPAPILDTLKRMGAVAKMEIPADEAAQHGPGAIHKFAVTGASGMPVAGGETPSLGSRDTGREGSPTASSAPSVRASPSTPLADASWDE